MLTSMTIVETGGNNVSDANGATGVMQIKPAFWDDRARSVGYDLRADEGQIGMAAAILGGHVPGVRGADPTERFLHTYYPVLNADGSVCYDCRGESGQTPRMYLDDIARYSRLIAAAAPAAASAAAAPGPVRFGRVPMPTNIVDDFVDKPQGMGRDDLGPRQFSGVVLHRVEGRARFASSHFRSLNDEQGRDALTDWGVDADVIYNWNGPDGRGQRRSPWVSDGPRPSTGDEAAPPRSSIRGLPNGCSPEASPR